MYHIEMEHECSCFKKSNLGDKMTFETKEDALMRAKVLECRMNQEFCFTHFFEAVDYGDKIVIHSSLRPVDDDDDDEEDIRDLIAKSPVNVVFDEGAPRK